MIQVKRSHSYECIRRYGYEISKRRRIRSSCGYPKIFKNRQPYWWISNSFNL